MAVRDDFASGEVLQADDLNDTFASKVDYATPTNAQAGTAYTFVSDDAERITTASNGSAVTFTIPPQSSVTWGDDTILRVVNYGAGAVTVDGGSGVTVTNTATTIAQYQAAAAIRTGSDAWTLVPFAGGGEIPAAEISSPAATGQYTDTGVTYDYYTFTASGTLTVDTAGFADILVIGGGGSSGKNTSASTGGGGAGGHLLVTDAYLSATTHTVTVGAGAAASWTGGNTAGLNGNASRLGPFYGVGGGGGGSGPNQAPTSGGSGGGAGQASAGSPAGGAGTSGQGSNGGGGGGYFSAGGGGGAGAVGATGSGSTAGGAGGAGTSSSLDGSATTRAGGGGGGGNTAGGAGGSGGGGAGAAFNASGSAGSANTGGGGGGGGGTGNGAAGGSGIVIVRVKV